MKTKLKLHVFPLIVDASHDWARSFWQRDNQFRVTADDFNCENSSEEVKCNVWLTSLNISTGNRKSTSTAFLPNFIVIVNDSKPNRSRQ